MDGLAKEFAPQAAAVVCGGMRGPCRTVHGISAWAELVSALQKYARRGEADAGMRCLLDALCQALAPAVTKPNLKAVLTNVSNRLLVMSAEDCLHPGIYVAVLRLYRRWDAGRSALTADALSAIASLYATLAAARKGRMPSVVKLFVGAASLPDAWRRKWGDAVAVPPDATFEGLLERRDLRCAALLEKHGGGAADHYASSWRVMRDSVRPVGGAPAVAAIDALRGLYDAMRGHREVFLFLYQAVALAVHRHRVASWTDAPAAPEAFAKDRVVGTLRAHLSDPAPIVLAAYCVDMHTARGRAAGKNAVDFALEGARVTNADAGIVPADQAAKYAEMYVDSKRMQEGVGASRKRPAPEPDAPDAPDAPNAVVAAGRGGWALSGKLKLEALPVVEPVGFVPLLQRTCGAKPMTYRVSIGAEDVAMKPASSADAVVFDRCKALFGLRPLGARLVRAACRFTQREGAGGGKEYAVEPGAPLGTFLIARMVLADAGSTAPAPMVAHPDAKAKVARDPALVREFFRIALVRWLFGVTDFCSRNVLVAADGRLVSIDENGIGSSSAVFPHWHQARGLVAANVGALRLACGDVLRAGAAPGVRGKLVAAMSADGLIDAAAATQVVDRNVFARLAVLKQTVAEQTGHAVE